MPTAPAASGHSDDRLGWWGRSLVDEVLTWRVGEAKPPPSTLPRSLSRPQEDMGPPFLLSVPCRTRFLQSPTAPSRNIILSASSFSRGAVWSWDEEIHYFLMKTSEGRGFCYCLFAQRKFPKPMSWAQGLRCMGVVLWGSPGRVSHLPAARHWTHHLIS